ncbi:YsnF/AvaK domain-containing protein [Noviherbaspirillum sp. UKPF54]|uniref:YsnF/AvaK domain-containing protein n=1 Tax=Noviherbaspirillum sp. UKPF54 TaxID=2601898 RepID=UPI001FED7BF2|nr:YsnF/AvaK domain-containing protein [Noviherbaspirillum sp. UKPF54]
MAHFHDNGSTHLSDGTLANARVIDAAGHQAAIVSTQHVGAEEQAWIRIDGGTRVLVPVSLLASESDGTFRLPFTFDIGSDAAVQMSFPVLEEQMQVEKRIVDTGRGVRLHKTVAERERLLDEPLRRDELVVEHVPVGQIVQEAAPPQARYEGDTLVVPVLEEVLMVQKQLLLKEEVRITRRQHQVREPQSVVLRSEQVAVERFDEGAGHTPQ